LVVLPIIQDLPFLQDIRTYQFRNCPDTGYRFEAGVVAVCGPNGRGKTNLLDAIHYLGFTRSYFTQTDPGSVRFGCQGFRIDGNWESLQGRLNTTCILREQGKKEFYVDGEACSKFSTHIGRLPLVFIAPDDIALINEGGEGRRKFMDTLISQLDPSYLESLIRYNRILQERNSLLKSLATQPSSSLTLLDVLDHQLSTEGGFIHRIRQGFMEHFIPSLVSFYNEVSGSAEKISPVYVSQLQQEDMLSLLRKGRFADLQVQRTRAGIHRDDLETRMDGLPFRQTASQGQRKSLLFALKLAAFEVLRKEKGTPPLLLLDDIFEKLDEQRMQNLLHRVCVLNQGQVFLTDTHQDRVTAILGGLNVPFQLITL
jgi:DNA replication and repair protein RecF